MGLELNTKKSYVNFSTFDFLGISKKLINKNNNLRINDLDNPISGEKLEESLGKIFNQPVSFIPEESIHETVMPEMVSHNDLLIIDSSVNTKIKIASDSLQKDGISSIYINHNRIGELEELINGNKDKYNKIWYIAQSIYTLSGDNIPVLPVLKLIEKYDQFYLYTDDSDGLSWTGERGMGFMSQNFPGLKKTVIVASLTKGFGAEDGAVVSSGDGLNYSIIPPQNTVKNNLYRNIANSIDIHLSEELKILQLQLQEKIQYFNNLSALHSLPVKSNSFLPTKFILIGSSEVCHEICAILLDQGIYVGSGFYPHLPKDECGIIVNITVNHSKREIKDLITSINEAYQCAVKKTLPTLGCKWIR